MYVVEVLQSGEWTAYIASKSKSYANKIAKKLMYEGRSVFVSYVKN